MQILKAQSSASFYGEVNAIVLAGQQHKFQASYFQNSGLYITSVSRELVNFLYTANASDIDTITI